MADFKLGRLKFVWKGLWNDATAYVKDDVVRYGPDTFICLLAHTSSVDFAVDQTAGKWELMVEGGTSPTTNEGDMIFRGAIEDERLPVGSDGSILLVDNGVPTWESIGTEGQALIVKDGQPQWLGLTTADSIYYVKADGNDDNDGSNLNQAFKTIKHACSVVTGPATIYVKGGLYYEQLPILVRANITVVGDGQRTTGVAPVNITNDSANIVATSGNATTTTMVVDNTRDIGGSWQKGDTITISNIVSGSGITGPVTITNVVEHVPSHYESTITVSFSSQTVTATECTISSDHSRSTMWKLSDGATLNKMYFTGMTGFEPDPNDPENIASEDATIAGVFVALNDSQPIVNKSPYVLECACFSTGGIGAIVDGNAQVGGIKSMVFHGYTCVNSDGVGYWVNADGKAEIVSCFTYYCWFGYVTTNGGKIRALNGNNSYGTYGAVSSGYLASEATNDGVLYGDQIEYDPITLTGEFTVGDTITGQTSGATGVILNVQASVNKLYYHLTSTGTPFQGNEIIDNGDGATVTTEYTGITGQKGFVLIAKGFSAAPKVGGSIELSDDNFTYVIQSYSGTWTNSNSLLAIVLAGEKPTPSPEGTTLKIRYQYSQTRLTGHDFLNIGTGNKVQTNYPGTPLNPPSQGNEVIENYPGRVFYVSTDQDGNFRVGEFFKVDQATGRATLNASAFDLSGLTSLRLGSIGAQLGEAINEFSSDVTLSGDSNLAVPTEHAVRSYFLNVDTNIIPSVDNTFTLGSPTHRWNHVYVAGGSLTVGSLTITDNAGTLEVKSGTDAAPTVINSIINGTSNVTVAKDGNVTVVADESTVITAKTSGEVDILGSLYSGSNAVSQASTLGLTGVSAFFKNTTNSFTQVSTQNTSNGSSASTDFIAYADNGDNESGWIDMGITSSAFNDATYGVTGENDGYIFMSAPATTTGNGNLYISTSDNGAQNDIVFSTNGFTAGTERARIVGIAHDNYEPGFIVDGEIQAFGNGIYQGVKGDGTTAKELMNDYNVETVTSSVGTITYSTNTLVLSYTPDGVLENAANGHRIEIENYSGAQAAPINKYHTITNNNTTLHQITVTATGVTGSGTLTKNPEISIRWYGTNSFVGLTNCSGIFTGDNDGFVQFAIKNFNAGTSASTDFIAYASNGDNESGWIDMGITSESFSDAAYGVTGPDDGYIFMKASNGSTGNGNLYLSTADTGVQNDIVFSTNGFGSGNERMRIIGTDRVGKPAGVEIYIDTESTSSTTGALRVTGGIGLDGNLNVGGDVSITGTISIGGSGSSLETTTLAVSDPMIRMGTGNGADIIDLGFYGQYSSITTTLNGALNSSNTTIIVTDASSFPATGVLIVDSEMITYTGKTGTSFTGCTRGANGSTATTHTDTTPIYVPYYTGLVRDASDSGKFKLFTGLNTVNPLTTVDFTASNLSYAGLQISSLNATTGTFTGNTTVKGTFAIQGASSGAFTLQVPAAAGSATYTLPSADGSNGHALRTNGAGTLTWAEVGPAVSDDTSTATLYPVMSTSSTGFLAGTKVSTTKFSFNASTGILTATGFSGPLNGTVGATTPAAGTFTSLTASGTTTLQQVTEVLYPISSYGTSQSTAFTNGGVYLLSGMSGNFTFNWTSVPTTTNRTFTLTLILSQGGTPYIPSTLQINGSGVTINWAGGATPTGRANKIDIVSFMIYYTGSFTAVAQLSSYG